MLVYISYTTIGVLIFALYHFDLITIKLIFLGLMIGCILISAIFLIGEKRDKFQEVKIVSIKLQKGEANVICHK